MTRFLCARCGQPRELMHVTCRECEEALQDRIYELEKLSDEFLVEASGRKFCGLCRNTGKLHLHATFAALTPRDADQEVEVDGVPCICPFGRAIKEKMG